MLSLLPLPEAVLDHLELEALPAQPQPFSRPRDVAVTLLKAAGDDLFFHPLHVASQRIASGRFRQARRVRAGFSRGLRDLRRDERHREEGFLRHQDHPFDEVFQLPDVSQPGIGKQAVTHLRIEPLDPPAQLPVELGQKVVVQGKDVLGAVTACCSAAAFSLRRSASATMAVSRPSPSIPSP